MNSTRPGCGGKENALIKSLLHVVTEVPSGPAVTLVLFLAALILARPLAVRAHFNTFHVALLLASFGLVLAWTLPPGLARATAPSCSLDVWRAPDWLVLLPLGERSLNVILLIPLGLTIGWVRPLRRRTPLVLLAATLPFLVEAWQYVLPGLGRYCDTRDIADNLLGLGLGLLLSAGLRMARPGRQSHRSIE